MSLLIGGLIAGLSLAQILWNSLPILLISALLFVGIVRNPENTVHRFQLFAKLIHVLAILGLLLGAVSYMTGWGILGELMPLAEAMEAVCSIAIVMLGSLPLAE